MNFSLTSRRLPIITVLAVSLIAAIACTSGDSSEPTTSPVATESVPATATPVEPTTTPFAPPTSGDTAAEATRTALAATEFPDSTVAPATRIPVVATATAAGPPVQQEPASNRIAFASADGEVYTISPDGSDRQRISHDGSMLSGNGLPSFFDWPTWSPDGRYALLTVLARNNSGGFDTTLYRAPVEPPGALPLLLYSDLPGTTGIGGVAHFPVWRPDGGAVALIANTGPELATFVIDIEESAISVVSTGAPVYLDWSRDGSHMLVHTLSELVLHDFDSSANRTNSEVIGTGSFSYRTPKFSPSSNEYLYIDAVDDVQSLFKGSVGTAEPELITTSRAGSAFSWAPDGERLAFADGDRAGFYDSLRVIDLARNTADVTVEISVLAFWWSPDGTRLLAVTLGKEPGSLALSVVDSRTGEVTLLGLIEPTPEMAFVISFFDQYAADLSLWSPDSSLIVFAGVLSEGLADPDVGTVVQTNNDEASVWVIDPSGVQSPVSLGMGSFGTWSPG